MNSSTGVLLLMAILVLGACASSGPETSPEGEQDNPLLGDWNTPFETPPFDAIREEHFKPAFEKAMAQQLDEVAAIVESPDPPTFENTVEALESSGRLLDRATLYGDLNTLYSAACEDR